MPAETEPLEERFGSKDPAAPIDGLMRADWEARKLIKAREDAAAEAVKFDEIIAEWTAAREAAVRKIMHDVEQHEYRLTMFLVQHVEGQGEDADPTVPVTVKLPCGAELQYRPNGAGQPALRISDQADALNWCEANLPQAIKRGLDNATVKEALKRGAPIPGARLVEPDSEPYRVVLPKGQRS